MLVEINIKRLFSLYDYQINLLDSGNCKIHFLTSPNGYGKTTILEMIHALLIKDFSRLVEIPFSEFSLFFVDNVEKVRLSVIQERTAKSQDLSTDLLETPEVKLCISLFRIEAEKEVLIDTMIVQKKTMGVNIVEGNGNLDMFFVSKTCHYLTDNRLLRKKTDVKEYSTQLDTINIDEYALKLKVILKDPARSELYKDRINLFQKIIDKCEFASKDIEITHFFGFRFIARDEFNSKLSLNALSSGEKHMIIQLYELLFEAQDGTLVLIDEPELSLHMMWQMNYLKFLEEISKLRGYQCIVATHSPQIFNSMWSLTTDLFTISNSER